MEKDEGLWWGTREGKAAPPSAFQPHATGKAIDRENLPGNPRHPRIPSGLFSSRHMPTAGSDHGPAGIAEILILPSIPFLAMSHSCSRMIISASLFGRNKEGEKRSSEYGQI